ncbi:hypothetical protein [Pseudoalteromonas sp. McH1-42]|uniref:hypothetical protein n=1 Tax=Pseudoalteromonas sp. McH1-42 TaxID=2917752 RepID=UPI001EF463BE|nr:hypothetical protein [Pseudoalteromonas sp. McH1-42]MCG7561328.1 hypothetical protein [Pseudoalteromonas sp. McH1-42]
MAKRTFVSPSEEILDLDTPLETDKRRSLDNEHAGHEFVLQQSHPDQQTALYLFNPLGQQKGHLYFYYFGHGSTAPLAEFSLADSEDISGCYVFSNDLVAPDQLLTELDNSDDIITTGLGTSRLAWRLAFDCDEPDERYKTLQTTNVGAVFEDTFFAVDAGGIEAGLSNRWGLLLTRRATLTLDAKMQQFVINNPKEGQKIAVQLQQQEQQIDIGSKPELINIPLSGDRCGAMVFDWQWSHYQLNQYFSGELKMFFGHDADMASTINYPLFTPAEQQALTKNNLNFKVFFQQLAPLDGRRTRMVLQPDATEQVDISSCYFNNTANSSVPLKPLISTELEAAAGFAWARNSLTDNTPYYLCPVGHYEVGSNDDALSNSSIALRCGVSANEFFLLSKGDILAFEVGLPAFVNIDKRQNPEGAVPDDSLSSSWLQVIPAAKEAVGKLGSSYCIQAASATYFVSVNDKPGEQSERFPIAVGASLVQFHPQNNPFVPMLPYGGVFFQDNKHGIASPNANLSAGQLAAFENLVVAPCRRRQLSSYFNQSYGPVFFDINLGQPFDGGYMHTPLGLLAKLNEVSDTLPPAGTINQITLATSPQNPDQQLAFTANTNGVVNPLFANAMLNDNLFLVATDASALAPMQNKIQLGDFTFDIKPGNGEEQSIVIFKFMPDVSLAELINHPDRWTSLVGDQDLTQVQSRLQEYLAVAKNGEDLFADFRQMAEDPNWNGVLFFNVPLDYQSLPLDIQILLGGIQGQLRAHHFGITTNRIDSVGSRLDYSSLFSVIHYQHELEAPSCFPDFQVLLFNVRYANSKLVVFDSRIGFSIDQLLECPVDLAVATEQDNKTSGTIVIDGVYTLTEDGTGTLLFATKEPRSFKYNSHGQCFTPLIAQSITNAQLVPVSRQEPDEDGTVLAYSTFRIDGVLAFDDDIGGDLFSYGEFDDANEPDLPTAGLCISGYGFNITTEIRSDNSADIEGPITTDLSGLMVDQGLSHSRKLSFDATFPCLIDSLSHQPGGLEKSLPGVWEITVGDEDFSGNAVFSINFSVPLGSLGMLLSDKTELSANISIGWDPKASSKNEGVGLVLSLPSAVNGAGGFELEGVINTSFERVQLNQVALPDSSIYALLFVHFQGQLLNLMFNYSNKPKDLGLFGAPGSPGSGNPILYQGKSIDSNWSGPTLALSLDGVPSTFVGRSFDIVTDPTNPNVISETFERLNPYTSKTVEQFIQQQAAKDPFYSSSAGVLAGLQFEFKSLGMTVLLHDDSFYGAQVKIDTSKSKPVPPAGGELTSLMMKGPKPGDKPGKGFLSIIDNFEFTIIYRKVNDQLGVWSADIYVDLKDLKLGIFKLSLPNFSIAIWTNGDWRFAIGWPFEGEDAHPFSVAFKAGPYPLIAKAGFYLAKLSSAAAPDQFGDHFDLIWSFGAGLAGGLEEKYKVGPLSATASLIQSLTVQGFLASYNGTLTEDGVDYWWWAISQSLTGKLSGKVDFVVIAASVSISLSFNIAFAIETKHSTPLLINVKVKAQASLKVIFVKLSFSFETRLDLFNFTFGSGPAASLDNPTPNNVLGERDNTALIDRYALAPAAQQTNFVESGPGFIYTPADPVDLPVDFSLLTTSVSDDNITWKPQGVAILTMVSDGPESPFGLMCISLAKWLIGHYGGDGNFATQLDNTLVKLQQGAFSKDLESALSALFRFNIGSAQFTEDTATVVMAAHPDLILHYNTDDSQFYKGSNQFGAKQMQPDYLDVIRRYFDQQGRAENSGTCTAGLSMCQMVFNNYFMMLAQQLIAMLKQSEQKTLDAAIKKLSMGDLSGFVSRFMMAGVRLPIGDNNEQLKSLYALTGQQFTLHKSGNRWILDATLSKADDAPSYLSVNKGTRASLDPGMVHEKGPDDTPWLLKPLQPLSPANLTLAFNQLNNWRLSDNSEKVIGSFSAGLMQSIAQAKNKLQDGDAPWLRMSQHGPQDGETAHADLNDAGSDWQASAALAITVELAAIPDPNSPDDSIISNIFSLLGCNEADRALLQKLLEAIASEEAAVDEIQLLSSSGQGQWQSTTSPSVLVRTDLSTNNMPGGQNGADVTDSDGPINCINYSKPAESVQQKIDFLQLVWEVSTTNSKGFYLQLEGLDKSLFKQGNAELILLVQLAQQDSIIRTAPWQNALIGSPPEKDNGIFATLASDSLGTPIKQYNAAYPGGDVGWQVEWDNAPIEADAISSDYLKGLYQILSYRVTAINGQPKKYNWSRGQTPQDVSDTKPKWLYQQNFASGDLSTPDGRYAAIGDVLTIEISSEDVFGNSLPDSFNRKTDLVVQYNDNILGIGDWVGVTTSYKVVDNSGNKLRFEFVLDSNIILDDLGQVNEPQRLNILQHYQLIASQLADKNMNTGVSTSEVLNRGLIYKTSKGDEVQANLLTFIEKVIVWLTNANPDAPFSPVSIELPLDKNYPQTWKNDLQRLQVSIEFYRRNVEDEIASLVPNVRRVISAIQPVEQKAVIPNNNDDDKTNSPSGLTTFAIAFEKAYYQFDDAEGTVKVATGMDSQIGHQSFGKRSIWLQRWSELCGTSVEILNDEQHQPVYYAPPPLSTRLISRKVDNLRHYSTDGQWQDTTQIFNGVDMDTWGAEFLNAVETVFSPMISTGTARASTHDNELYNPFVNNKESLAETIGDSIEYIYNLAKGSGDINSAQQTWRQALLQSLSKDYGFSALMQLQANVKLNGELEPDGDKAYPPRLYGTLQSQSASQQSELPFSLTPATLSLVDGKGWLNSLISAKDPARQNAVNTSLNYQISQLEHLRDSRASKCGYVPSSWLTYVLQQNPKNLSDEHQNTLTKPIGDVRIPIPLRTYPPLPVLRKVSAVQHKTINTIGDALSWNLSVSMARPVASQDTLNLMLHFNLPLNDLSEKPLLMSSQSAVASRPAPEDLFEALARFEFEYPQLAANINAIGREDSEQNRDAVTQFSELVTGVANTWPSWHAPEQPNSEATKLAEQDDTQSWHYAIDQLEGGDLLLAFIGEQSQEIPPWPQITGYRQMPHEADNRSMTYIAEQDELPVDLELNWTNFYILDFQSVRPSAYTERNRNLAPSPETTNPAFVYHTQTVYWPNPVVPLINVGQNVELPNADSLQAGVEQLLQQLKTPPPGSITNGSRPALRYESAINYRYQVMAHQADPSVTPGLSSEASTFNTDLPVFLFEQVVSNDKVADAAEVVTQNLANWQAASGAQAPNSMIVFTPTIFATTIVSTKERLPLVQLNAVALPVGKTPNWWEPQN